MNGQPRTRTQTPIENPKEEVIGGGAGAGVVSISYFWNVNYTFDISSSWLAKCARQWTQEYVRFDGGKYAWNVFTILEWFRCSKNSNYSELFRTWLSLFLSSSLKHTQTSFGYL